MGAGGSRKEHQDAATLSYVNWNRNLMAYEYLYRKETIKDQSELGINATIVLLGNNC